MSELITVTPSGIKPMMEKMSYYKFNPGMIQSVVLDYLSLVSNGEVDLVDPTNPFVFLLESSSVATAAAILENQKYLRMQYPSLATNEEELYIHLSDKDLVNRFAKPSTTSFKILILKSDLDSKMVLDSDNDYYKIVIPRNTEFTVGGHSFSIQYPIEIRKMKHDGIVIVYDTAKQSPLQLIDNNVIDYNIYRDPQLNEWLTFNVPVLQLASISHEIPINEAIYFNETVEFTDQFHYVRVYYRKDNINLEWVEMATTLTDQVFDIKVPTAIIKVYDGKVNISIPKIYLSEGIVGGIIRMDIFTTKGAISFHTGNYTLASFVTVFKALDRDNDLSKFTTNISALVLLATNDQLVSGGENGLGFEELRSRLIYNSLSGNRLPITNIQMSSYLRDLGFKLVTNTDVVTNRIFVASRKMVLPDDYSVYTPTDAIILTFIDNLETLKTRDRVINNHDRLTIRSNSIFKDENGQLRLLDDLEASVINDLEVNTKLEELNTGKYYLLPFYYVLDASMSEFETRAYHLDAPKASSLNYIDSNGSFSYYVNVDSYELFKTDTGYRLLITTKSSSGYQDLDSGLIGLYLSFLANNETELCFVKATMLAVTENKERIFEVVLDSSLDIDSTDLINIDNVKIYRDYITSLKTSLTTTVNLCFTVNVSDTNVIPNVFINKHYPSFLESPTTNGLCLYKVDLTFGYTLKTMWNQARSYTTNPVFKRYETNIPLRYAEDVYKLDPVTGCQFGIVDGAINCNILHYKNDIVYDDAGDVIYAHKVGDIMLSQFGVPIPVGDAHIFRMVDLFLLDARYYYSTDTYSRTYLNLIIDNVFNWVYNILANVTSLLLEQTKLYFKPVNSRGFINVYNDVKAIVSIDASQQFKITYYVNGYVFNNPDLRNKIRATTMNTLNSYMGNEIVSTSEIIRELQTLFINDVIAIDLSGLGGDANYNTIRIINPEDSLNIRKDLYRLSDSTLAVRESIDIQFVQSV